MTEFLKIVIISLTVIGGFFFIFAFCGLLIGKSVCKVLGHDWEHISRDTIDKKDGSIEIWTKDKCRNCGITRKAHYIYQPEEKD